jgi:metal-dependent amidase/aminoacylase/carboxypeptidase family protein
MVGNKYLPLANLFQIWSNPELAYEEYEAHDHICELFNSLQSSGYKVRPKAYGLQTALEVEYTHGSGGRVVVFNAEYGKDLE